MLVYQRVVLILLHRERKRSGVQDRRKPRLQQGFDGCLMGGHCFLTFWNGDPNILVKYHPQLGWKIKHL